jgi:hypothetical protein
VPVPVAAWLQFADSIGLPTDEGIFGFKPFAEVWCGEYRRAGPHSGWYLQAQMLLLSCSSWYTLAACMSVCDVSCFACKKLNPGMLWPLLCAGRLAMMGFVVSIVEEAMGNGGTLGQIGIDTPSTTVLGLALGLAGTATLVGTANTAYKLFSRKMTPGDIARWGCRTAPAEAASQTVANLCFLAQLVSAASGSAQADVAFAQAGFSCQVMAVFLTGGRNGLC